MSGWKGTNYLKSKYAISGCMVLQYEGSYVDVSSVVKLSKNIAM